MDVAQHTAVDRLINGHDRLVGGLAAHVDLIARARIDVLGHGALAPAVYADLRLFDQAQIAQLDAGLDDARLYHHAVALGFLEDDGLFVYVEYQDVVALFELSRQLVAAVIGLADRIGGVLEGLEPALELSLLLGLVAALLLRLLKLVYQGVGLSLGLGGELLRLVLCHIQLALSVGLGALEGFLGFGSLLLSF